MSDYWKSLPRKFCEFCKCWITDNKPSVDFHEKGKRHQENVQRKLGDLRRKGKKDYEAQKKMDHHLKKMNEAAMKAIQKDIVRDPSLAKELEQHLKKTEVKSEAKPKMYTFEKPKPTTPEAPVIKIWLEAKTEGGQIYYVNTESGKTVREPPVEGYVSIREQKREMDEPTFSGIGPAQKPDPYGKWVPVTPTPLHTVDLQLPVKNEEPTYQVVTEVREPTLKFKERTVASLGIKSVGANDSSMTFKKRKINSGCRRNVRVKTEEDD